MRESCMPKHIGKEKVCECGWIIKGMNESILDLNIETHLKGKKHREAMLIKNRLSGANLVINEDDNNNET